MNDSKLSRIIQRDKKSLFGLLLGFLQGASAVALLATSAWLISKASEMPNVVEVSLAVVGVRAFAVGRAGFRYAERLVQHDSAFRFVAGIRKRLVQRMIPLTPVGLSDLSAGKATKRFVDDVDELQNLSLRVTGPLIQALLVNTVSSIFLSILVPLAGLALFVFGTLSIVGGFFLGLRLVQRAQRLSADSRERISDLATSYAENYETVFSFGWQKHFAQQLTDLDRSAGNSADQISFQSAREVAMVQALATLTVVSSAVFGAFAVSAGQIAGVWLAVVALLPLAVFDVIGVAQSTGSAWHKFVESRERIVDVLERQPLGETSKTEENPVVEVNRLGKQGFESLEFKNADLGYPAKPVPVVENLNLAIGKGETWVFTGPSGSGKSTTALSMLGFLPVLKGQLLLNGTEIENVPEPQLRKIVGLVEQVPVIFSGSVKQNLLIAKPSATDEELISVLISVNLWDTFSARESLDTEVGEFGRNISGGEAQRISLARVLLAEFPLVIMDEPTANLDTETAGKLIRDAIALTQAKQSTLVLITHDLDLAKLPAYEVAFETNSGATRIR